MAARKWHGTYFRDSHRLRRLRAGRSSTEIGIEKSHGTTYASCRRHDRRGAANPHRQQRRSIMLTYIALASFTDQGLRSIKDTTKRAAAARDTAGRFGVKMKEIYWTQGQYDIVTLCEADNEAAMAAFGLALASAGNVRFQTLRAFTSDEVNGILSKLP
jgi:uncharacterized protein with GYD domain